jgi:hypothetical protein
MTITGAINYILSNDSAVAGLVGTYLENPAIFNKQIPADAVDIFPSILIFPVTNDFGLASSRTYQVSIKIENNNESLLDDLTLAVIDALDGITGTVGNAIAGYAAINSIIYTPFGGDLLEDGGIMHRPLTFQIMSNRA